MTERLREEVLDVETTYVNCWRNYTRLRTLYQILDDLDATIDIHRQSTPHDELIDRLQQHDGPRTGVFLDKVDQLEDPSVTYNLHSFLQFAMQMIANKERSCSAASTTASSVVCAPANTSGWTNTTTSSCTTF